MRKPAPGSRVAWMVVALACALAAGCGDDGDVPIDSAGIDARPLDAAVDAPAACGIAGVYSAVIVMPVFFRFNVANHTWRAALSEPELDTAPIIDGTYTFAGTTFTVTESPGNQCPETQTGEYSVALAPSCDFTLTLVTDPCADRGKSLDGATFTFPHP